MKTGCPYSVFLISCLLSFVCRAEKVTEFSTVEVKARQGKKTSITLLVPEKTDLDKFMRTNRMMAGMWAGGRMQRKKGGKADEFEMATRETKTHWIGDVHYPIFNYQGVRLYMIGGIKNSQISHHRKPATRGEGSFAQGFAHPWRPRPEGNRKTQRVRLDWLP